MKKLKTAFAIDLAITSGIVVLWSITPLVLGAYLLVADAVFQARNCSVEQLPPACFEDGGLRLGTMLLGGVVSSFAGLVLAVVLIDGARALWQSAGHELPGKLRWMASLAGRN